MGNCGFRGFGQAEEMIKVITSSGGVMELYAPITAECITNEFPGHGIFRGTDLFSSPPLLHNEELHAGELYYLLPLNTGGLSSTDRQERAETAAHTSSSVVATPYRMSLDNHHHHQGGVINKRSEAAAEVFPRYNSSGVWKVRLVISPEQLSEILSQETRTEELIESVRTVAKCGSGVPSVANSDKWSISSSSWRTASEKCTTAEGGGESWCK